METFFRVTDPLCGEFPGPRWVPRTKAVLKSICSIQWITSICAKIHISMILKNAEKCLKGGICITFNPRLFAELHYRIIIIMQNHLVALNIYSTCQVYLVECLTHLSLAKMVAISQTMFSNAFSWMKSLVFGSKFHWSLFLRGPIDNESSLVQVMAWRRTGNKPLPELMMTHINWVEAYSPDYHFLIYVIYEAVCSQLTHFSFDHWELYIYFVTLTLSNIRCEL